MPTSVKNQQGFTLLELLTVVAIMAIISGMSLMSYGNTRSNSELQAVRVEMEQLKLAVMHYFKDQNIYVKDSSPANIDFLTKLSPSWDADYRKGWRGPYIKKSLITANYEIANSTKLNFSGDGDPTDADESNPLIAISVKLDPYGQPYLFFDLEDVVGTPRIVSMGADGLYNTADDVVMEI